MTYPRSSSVAGSAPKRTECLVECYVSGLPAELGQTADGERDGKGRAKAHRPARPYASSAAHLIMKFMSPSFSTLFRGA
jgi:hypothetical protein